MSEEPPISAAKVRDGTLDRLLFPLADLNREMRAMLERLEWQDGDKGLRNCPVCDRWEFVTHSETCELAALLKRVRGEA